jgi:hypothetical protein
MALNWTCPHCDRAQAVTDDHFDVQLNHIYLKNLAEGSLALQSVAINCANESCRRLFLKVLVQNDKYWNNVGTYKIADGSAPIFESNLIPQGAAKPQPLYIPEAIRADYAEACLIRDLSPKSAATLARRVLQGMIRDFCGISKGTLAAEIKALEDAVDNHTAPRAVSVESIQAIDNVRKIGNIGAHMEKDINVIIDVDPEEAQILIELIETLLRDWYVERHIRDERFANLAAIRAQKDQQKLAGPAQSMTAPPSAGGSVP